MEERALFDIREINIEGDLVGVCQGDILVLSPSTFSAPDKLEFGKVTDVNNPESDVVELDKIY